MSALQVFPHLWKPALQVKPHEVPSHVAVPLAGAPHGVQDVPHEEMLVFEAQDAPHT